MKKMMTIEPASARMQKRRTGLIIATEKIVFIGLVLLGTGIVFGVFQDAIFGITDYAEIVVNNFQVLRQGADNNRLSVTATLENRGNLNIDGIVIEEFAVGDFSVTQAADTGLATLTNLATGCAEATTASSLTTPVDVTAAPCTTATGGQIQVSGIAFNTDVAGKSSAALRMTVVGGGEFEVSDLVSYNDDATIIFRYLVDGGGQEVSSPTSAKVKGR